MIIFNNGITIFMFVFLKDLNLIAIFVNNKMSTILCMTPFYVYVTT